MDERKGYPPTDPRHQPLGERPVRRAELGSLEPASLRPSVSPMRRRVARVIRVALVIIGITFGLWYWQQMRGVPDGVRDGPDDVREPVRDDGRPLPPGA